ncbi:histidinol-phosphate transaminase [Anaerocolumna xylanovorans]|uniref:Histidinol-phosphate aminotransferase n=1 Tax=Anaerocolumna xylanovorans DSM 12503 TaxID=1121345 RepID=A0A1M7XWY6_9FIRM|nr:histidinol-phosphate transaminase [Anaerocolumna xylanovorans]SHO43306.1 histidinol-phosphate aminotransferase [Anaerocolumna xylanovorans DSM 12503]
MSTGQKEAAPRKALEQINNYITAKTIESVKRELGIDRIIKLAGNENTNGYSPKVKEAIRLSLEGLSYYPDMNCTILREKLSKLHGVEEEQLIFGNGSFELISIIAQTYLEEGDESIIAEPSFGWYKNVTWQMGAKVVSLPLKNHKVDLEIIRENITDRTKIIWICNPNNPTGTILTEKELREFLQELPSGIILVLDEAYVDYVMEEGYPDSVSLLKSYQNVILLRTFSKAYGLASFRIGYGIASKQVVLQLNKVRLPINTNALAQTAAAASLEDREFYRYVLQSNKEGLKLYYKTLTELGLEFVPSNCNFILFNTGLDGDTVTGEYYKKGILIRSGKEFGLPTWVRISIGTREENELVLETLKEILRRQA